MGRYVGSVIVSGGSPAIVTIDDVDSSSWRADMHDIENDPSPGLVLVELVDGPRAGDRGVGQMSYVGGNRVPRSQRAVIIGRQPFAPGPDPEWDAITRRLR